VIATFEFYVAAKFEEKERVRALMRELRKIGGRITFDWTACDDTGIEGDERMLYRATSAMDDVGGVLRADAVILLWHPKLQGGLIEAGAAIGAGIPLVCVGVPEEHGVFFDLDAVSFEDRWRVTHFADEAAVIADLAWWRTDSGLSHGRISAAISYADAEAARRAA
jgi:hypothetical protein